MSIERVMGGFTSFDIECDNCGQSEYLDYNWDNLQGAIAEAKSSGWRIKSMNGECICLDCQEKEKK